VIIIYILPTQKLNFVSL